MGDHRCMTGNTQQHVGALPVAAVKVTGQFGSCFMSETSGRNHATLINQNIRNLEAKSHANLCLSSELSSLMD